MKVSYWLLAGVLSAGSAHAVPHYGPGAGPAMGPGAGPGMGPGMGPGPGAYMRGPRPGAAVAKPALALRAGVDKLVGFLRADEKPSPDALNAFLDKEIAPYFDFDYMAQSAGGRLFEQLDAEQQRAMIADIRQSFLAKMAEKLGAYDNQQVRFMPPRGGSDGRTAQVSAAILNPGSYPARLDFRLYRDGETWKVYDVSANGQSAIVHYRRQLQREMQRQRMQQMRQMPPPVAPGPRRGPAFGPGPAPMPPR